MTSPFDVTTANDLVRLTRPEEGAAASGSASFTVTNRSAVDEEMILGIVTEVVTTEDGEVTSDEGWFTIDRDRRPLAAGASDQVTVAVAVPSSAAAGTYAFRLRAYSAEGIADETAQRSPQVRLRVTESKAKKPWLLWLAAAAAVVVVAGVLWWLLDDDDDDFPQVGDEYTEQVESDLRQRYVVVEIFQQVEDPEQVNKILSLVIRDPDTATTTSAPDADDGGVVATLPSLDVVVGIEAIGLLEAPGIRAPALGASVGSSGDLSFVWDSVEGADRYEVSLARCNWYVIEEFDFEQVRDVIPFGTTVELFADSAAGDSEAFDGFVPEDGRELEEFVFSDGADLDEFASAEQRQAADGLVFFPCHNPTSLEGASLGATPGGGSINFDLGSASVSTGDRVRVSVRAMPAEADAPEGLWSSRIVNVS